MKQQTSKNRKIFDIVITCVEVIIVIFAITLSAIVIANPISSSAEVAKGNIKLLPVLTGSMDGTEEFYKENPDFKKAGKFKEGDLIIAKNYKSDQTLEVGQIITYTGNVSGQKALITHRIVDVKLREDGTVQEYIVQGDNRKTNPLTEQVAVSDILAVYDHSLSGVGKAINWLQNSTNFLLVVVLPLIALFIYNIVTFVLMIVKAKNAKENENAVVDEEEIKKKAIEEYLASQKENVNGEEEIKE